MHAPVRWALWMVSGCWKLGIQYLQYCMSLLYLQCLSGKHVHAILVPYHVCVEYIAFDNVGEDGLMLYLLKYSSLLDDLAE